MYTLFIQFLITCNVVNPFLVNIAYVWFDKLESLWCSHCFILSRTLAESFHPQNTWLKDVSDNGLHSEGYSIINQHKLLQQPFVFNHYSLHFNKHWYPLCIWMQLTISFLSIGYIFGCNQYYDSYVPLIMYLNAINNIIAIHWLYIYVQTQRW